MKHYGVKKDEAVSDDDDLDDLDAIDEPSSDDDALYDSTGKKVEIAKPMWTSSTKQKQEKKEDTGMLSWQKMPSRMSTGEWLLTLTFMCIPIVNIILLFIWAFFSDTVQDEKRNYARANIIIVCILTLVIMMVGVSFGGFNMSFKQLRSGTEQLSDQAKDSMKKQTRKEAQDAVGDYSGLTDAH